MSRLVPGSCKGENCTWCNLPAEHKVEEVLFWADPSAWTEVSFGGEQAGGGLVRVPARHPFTAYVCHACFVKIMGPAAS